VIVVAVDDGDRGLTAGFSLQPVRRQRARSAAAQDDSSLDHDYSVGLRCPSAHGQRSPGAATNGLHPAGIQAPPSRVRTGKTGPARDGSSGWLEARPDQGGQVGQRPVLDRDADGNAIQIGLAS